MKWSKHAKKRIQQRGIPHNIPELVEQFGNPVQRPGNAQEYRISKKDKPRIIAILKSLIREVEKACNIAVLVDGNNEEDVITIYHQRE